MRTLSPFVPSQRCLANPPARRSRRVPRRPGAPPHRARRLGTDMFPVTIVNCDVRPPTRRHRRPPSMNQAATEIMLALGLHDSMIGTAYLDDEILPEFADATRDPRAVGRLPIERGAARRQADSYGSYRSAFGRTPPVIARASPPPASAATTVRLPAPIGRPTSCSPPTSCSRRSPTSAIFGVSDRAEALIAEQRAQRRCPVRRRCRHQRRLVGRRHRRPSIGACWRSRPADGALGVSNVFDELPGSWKKPAGRRSSTPIRTDHPRRRRVVDPADKIAHLRATRHCRR